MEQKTPFAPIQTLPDIPEEQTGEGRWDFNLEALSYGMQRENPLSRWAADSTRQYMRGGDTPDFAYDPEYRVLDDDANYDYPPEQMVQARSADEAAYIRSQIDDERKRMEVINSSAWGTTGQIFGSIAQPQHVAAAFIAPQSLIGAIALEAAVEAGTEGILHSQQRLRTLEESYFNVGATAAGVAILGGAAKYFGDYNSGKTVSQAQQDSVVDQVLSGRSTGAMETWDDAIVVRITPDNAPKHEYDIMTSSEANSMKDGVIMESLAIGPLKKVLEASDPLAKSLAIRIVDNPFFTKAMEKGRTVGPAAESYVQSALGRAVVAVNEVADIRRKSGLSPKEFELELARAGRNNDIHPNPHVQQAAQKLREGYSKMAEELQKLGMLPKMKMDYDADIARLTKEITELKAQAAQPAKEGQLSVSKQLGVKQKELDQLVKSQEAAPESLVKYAESYFPRIYDKDAVAANYNTLKAKIEDLYRNSELDLDASEISDKAMDVMSNIMGNGTTRSFTQKSSNPVKERVLSLVDSELEPYLLNNGSAVYMQYMKNIAPFVEMQRVLGGKSIDDFIADISRNYQQRIDAAPTAKEKNKLAKEKAIVENSVRVMLDRVAGNIQRTLDPGSMPAKVIRWTKLTNILSQLGGVVFSSIPDLGRPIMHHGFRSYANGLAASVRQAIGGMQGMHSVQVKRLGAAIQRTLNQKLLDISDVGVGGSSVENTLGRWWGTATFFNRWTDFAESIAANTAMDWVLRMSTKVDSGKELSKSETIRLARMGFDINDLKNFYAEAKGTGGIGDSVLKYANTMAWTDMELAKKFEAGVGADVRRAIVRLGAGDKPEFLDNEVASLIFQYQSFLIGATNKLVVAGMQQRDLAAATGMLSMVFMGAMVEAGKGWLRGEDISTYTPEQLLMGGIDRSGLAGIYNIPFNVLRYAGAEAGLLEKKPARYQHREFEGVIGGPTITQIGRVARIITNSIEGNFEKAGEHAVKLLPFNDPLHIRSILTKMSEE
jgi:hypothetical protein